MPILSYREQNAEAKSRTKCFLYKHDGSENQLLESGQFSSEGEHRGNINNLVFSQGNKKEINSLISQEQFKKCTVSEISGESSSSWRQHFSSLLGEMSYNILLVCEVGDRAGKLGFLSPCPAKSTDLYECISGFLALLILLYLFPFA